MNFLISLYDRMISAFCWWLCAALPHRARVIPHAEDPGNPLLQQVLLWSRPERLVGQSSCCSERKPSVSVYLQHFLTPESPDYAHRHRWQYMRSVVLSGYFVEFRYQVWPLRSKLLFHRRLSTYTMNHKTIHQVRYWSRHCWTIFVAVNASDDWGYYNTLTGRFTHWRQHVKRRVPALETGELTQ